MRSKIDRRVILQLYKEGKNDSEIARFLNVTPAAVCNIRRKEMNLNSNRETVLQKFMKNLKRGFIFTKDIDKKERVDYHRIFSSHNNCNGAGIIYRKIIRKIKFPDDIPNIRKQTIYYRIGAEEIMFEDYILRVPKKTFNYITNTNILITSKRIASIRRLFGLPPIDNIEKYNKKLIEKRWRMGID